MERAIVQASSWVAVIDGLSNNFLGDPVYLKLRAKGDINPFTQQCYNVFELINNEIRLTGLIRIFVFSRLFNMNVLSRPLWVTSKQIDSDAFTCYVPIKINNE